jgi:predicted MFS family arabinose efflux permease
VLTPYVDVLRRPGAFRMSSTAFVARLPMSMIGIGEVLLVSSQTGSYGLAGALSATGALANSVFGPLLGRATDRYGQRRVTSLLVTLHVLAMAAFIVLVRESAPTWALFVSVTLSGGTFPNVGALVRSRWAFLLAGDPPALRTAFAYESVLDEAIYVVGPPLATVLAVSVIDYGALAAATAFLVVGTTLFLRSRATEPTAGGVTQRGQGSALRFPGVLTVTLAFIFLGGLFGAFEVVTVAFADESGIRGWTGLLLGLYALASGISGVVLGAVHSTVPMPRQLLVFSGLMALVTLPFPFLSSPWLLGLQCLLAGFAVSPVLINGFALIERLVPNARMTEGLVWTNTGIGLGIAISAALAGAVIDARGASTAYWICVVSALLTFGVVLVSTPTLSRAWQDAHAGHNADPAADPPADSSSD